MNDIHLLGGTQNQINLETQEGRRGHRGNIGTLCLMATVLTSVHVADGK